MIVVAKNIKSGRLGTGWKNMAKKILSEDSRERLVAAYENTKNAAAIALMFGVSESTVYRLVNQKRKTSSVKQIV